MVETNYFQCKSSVLPGSTYPRALKSARTYFKTLVVNTRRKPYIRSKYFKGQKVFLTLFWQHLFEKNRKQRTERLTLFQNTVELLRDTTAPPLLVTKHRNEQLFRFFGKTRQGKLFVVQVKLKNQKLYFISSYPK